MPDDLLLIASDAATPNTEWLAIHSGDALAPYKEAIRLPEFECGMAHCTFTWYQLSSPQHINRASFSKTIAKTGVRVLWWVSVFSLG